LLISGISSDLPDIRYRTHLKTGVSVWTLNSSTNIWFAEENNLEVIVLIDSSYSHYFKRRKMLPNQEIKEERPDGSIVVSTKVGQYESIRGIIKSWTPHIVILEPDEFKNRVLEDMKEWIKRQESAKKRVKQSD
jgi:predicted DNA-binding transcriptional regulator YafY